MITSKQKLIGNCFLNPAIDYLLIGSLWSIGLTFWFVLEPSYVANMDQLTLAILILAINSTHFAASTVRLYSKPYYYSDFPVLTLLFPLITFAVLVLAVLYPEDAGRHLQTLYLTWSPYHYAAQTYGLSVMYCYRSGYRLDAIDKRMLWWACMLPFLRSFLGANSSGLAWFIGRDVLLQMPILLQTLNFTTEMLLALIYISPLFLFVRAWKRSRDILPLIVMSMILANGLWWTVLDYMNAFVVATIAHSIQYLAIMLIFHVREKLLEPENKHGALFHSLRFYCISLLLGYGLFYCWPHAFVWAGFGLGESMILVIATINIHHFVVDRYIWRLRRPEAVNTMLSKAKMTI